MTDSNTAKAGEGTPPVIIGGDGTQAVKFSEEQQKIFDREQAALKDKLEREFAPFKKSHDELEKLKKQQNDQKLKETQDLELLKTEVGNLTPYKAKAETYQQKVKAIVDAKIALVPADKSTLIPKYDDPFDTLEWIEQNSKLLFGANAILNHPDSGGKPATGAVDPKLKEAQDAVLQSYPNIDLNSDFGKKKVADTMKILEKVR